MSKTQQFSLKWSEYLNHITNTFDSLRATESLVDVTLCCEGRKIRAHKLILSTCSLYFREVFQENPCQHPVIIFKNVNYEDLAAIIDFMYQGEVSVLKEHMPSFLHTAELLSVQGLTERGGAVNEEQGRNDPLAGPSWMDQGGAHKRAKRKRSHGDSSQNFAKNASKSTNDAEDDVSDDNLAFVDVTSIKKEFTDGQGPKILSVQSGDSQHSSRMEFEDSSSNFTTESKPRRRTKNVIKSNPDLKSENEAYSFDQESEVRSSRSNQNLSYERKCRLLEDAPKKILFSYNYTNIKEVPHTESGIMATCKWCGSLIKGTLLVSSNFNKHLKRTHPKKYAEYVQLKTGEKEEISLDPSIMMR